MGKLMHNTQIKHSSHPHLLQLSTNQNHCTCAGCSLAISPSDHIYACAPCNFFLHASCSKFPELITHPSHHQHTLSLLPTSIYPGGFFRCDACTQQGTRFSYHCQFCDFDLHVLCASKPLSVNHPFHPHPLLLTFSSPYGQKSGFSCDVCHNIGSPDQWLYRCVSCEFDVHMHCANAKMQPPLQHSHSYPGASSVPHQNQFVSPQVLSHSMSTTHAQSYQGPLGAQVSGGVQSYQGPQQIQASGGAQSYLQGPQQMQASGGAQSYQGPQQAPGQPQAPGQSYQTPAQQQPPAPVGAQGYQVPQQPPIANPNVAPGNALVDVAVTGFVDGMMQQLGQNLVQSLTGGGGGVGGDGGNGGGDVVNINYDCSTTSEDYGN